MAAAAQAAENQGEPNSNLTPLKFASNNRTKFKDILRWNISQMITNAILVITRTIVNYVMKLGISYWLLRKVNGN